MNENIILTANGYGRSDGVIALYIQRVCDAKRSYASILGARSFFSGYENGVFRDINVESMTDFIQKFYTDLEIDPKNVEFVECYGCGIKKYDEVELEAISRVYCKHRKDTLPVGSVKSNTGHAESSSVFMGLVKLLVALETGFIPANLHYNSPNTTINSLIQNKIKVVNKNREYKLGLVALNAMGLTPSYGHVLLKPNLKTKTEQVDNLPRLINISTRTEEGIQSILHLLKSEAKIDPEYVCLVQEAFKKTIPRHVYRGYAVLDGTVEAKSQYEYFPGNKRKIWFVYSGMGSQWVKMATDLMEIPVFAKAIYKCHKVLEPKGIDIVNIVTADDMNMFDNILHSFVGIAAIQIGLTDVLHTIGVVPDGIIGHSVGELGCAYADECLSAEQMILCAYSRGKASLEANLSRGMMAAVGIGYQRMKDLCPPSIEIACHNAADSSTISGPAEDMEAFVETLHEKNVFAKLVNVSNIAYHSRYIKPAAPLLLKYLQKIIPEPLPRSSKWISTSISEELWNTDLAKTSSAEYHTNNLLSSVLFEEGSKHIPQEAIVIEIAPHGLLQAILKRSLPQCVHVPLTHKTSKNGLVFLLEALGKMYLSGVDINMLAMYPRIEYPVGRGTKSLVPLIHWSHTENLYSYIDNKINYVAATNIKELQVSSRQKEYEYLIGHQLQNTIIIPTSAYIGWLYDVICSVKKTEILDVVIENLNFKSIAAVPKTGSVNVTIIVRKGSGTFEITSDNELLATGIIKNPDKSLFTDISITGLNDSANIINKSLLLSEIDVYSEFSHRKQCYSGKYRRIKSLVLTKEGSLSTIYFNNNWQDLVEAMIQQTLFHKGERYQNTLVVTSIQNVTIAVSELPKEPTDIQATYHYDAEIIKTAGIQISRVTTKSLKMLGENNMPISYDFVQLVKLTGTNLQSMESVIHLGLKMCVENLKSGSAQNLFIMEIQTEAVSLESTIRNVVDKNPNIKVSTTLQEKFVFALDKNAPEFTVDEPEYQKILKDDLALVVIKNGSINTYVTVPRELGEDKRFESEKASNVVGNISMEYIGINACDETLLLGDKYDQELGSIDYAGITSSGKRIMGLAQMNVNLHKLIPDSVLSWDIPQKWSMEDAATVPYAFVLAYYALVTKAGITPGETVLVHNGCTPFGLAAILLAAKHSSFVFTTVTSDRQRSYLKKFFNFMHDKCILTSRSTSFEAHLLTATAGKGANIILNCVSGSMLNASLRCIANMGRFIQLGKFDLEENMEIGMRVFARNVHFCSVTIEDVFCAADDVKETIRNLITKGLESFAVRPLTREITKQQNAKSLLRYVFFNIFYYFK
ncbi:hypothetical protein ILUMI_00040 [Ignelater luminosus]|uniref:Uncharacterized protein n=1 Tax=Ignelater luminosus TaxID=2038154 RepID=A0A8K0GNH3_IGNLU|nr:hypothetical protein ILUMI_00040 [Ignelater luminosus]